MKQLLLAGTAFLAFASSHPAAKAAPIVFDFTFTGSLVNFTVPITDTYQILAFGAQGGSTGGLGAEIGGDFSLTAGDTLQIAVGGAGMSGGGGGGSFVVGPGNSPLVIAGAGGGGPGGGPGLAGQDGGDGHNADFGSGGTGGTGGGGGGVGGIAALGGAGGGGFLSAGGGGPRGGGAFPDLTGGTGGGGFGGGGGPGNFAGGGGGGGYSGGGGGGNQNHPIVIAGGGGGGSFDAGTDQILMADFRTGDGEVIVTEVAAAVPEPASIALLGAGLLGFAAMLRRRRRS